MSGSSPNVFHIIRLAFARSSINGTRHVETKEKINARQRKKKLHTICMEPELQGRDAQVAVSPRSGHGSPQTRAARDGKLVLVCWIMACKFKIEVGGLPQTHLDTSQHG
jgi:hypothetical protein